MANTREQIDALYGGKGAAAGPTVDKGALVPAATGPAPTVSKTTIADRRAEIDAKYGQPQPVIPTATPAPQATPAPAPITPETAKYPGTDKNKSILIQDPGTGTPMNSIQGVLADLHLPNFVVNSKFIQSLGSTLDDTANRIGKFISTDLIDHTGTPMPITNYKSNPVYEAEAAKLSTQKEKDAILPKYGTPVDVAGRVVNTDANGNPIPSVNPSSAQKVAAAVEAGVGVVNIALSPLTAAYKQAEQIPIVNIPLKAVDVVLQAIGQGVTAVSNKAIDSLPISQETKDAIRGPIGEAAALAAQFAAGKVGAEKITPVLKDKATFIQDKITKDLITSNKLPQHVYIDAAKVKDIFQTGKLISPEESDLVRTLGLDAAGYKQAFKDGLSIEIPAETLTRLVDKPYWAKVKSALGLEPTDKVISAQGGGAPRVGPRGYLEAGQPRDLAPTDVVSPDVFSAAKVIPGVTENVAAPKIVTQALETPVTPKVLQTISDFTQPQAAAFSKKVVDSINESLGTKLDESSGLNVPNDVQVFDTPSKDGRPAQFNNGKIELFMPNLINDIRDMANGKQLLAHDGKYSKVYKLESGESIQDLAVRYTKDVLIHEASHEKTMTVGDATAIQAARQEVIQARASGDTKALTAAQTKLEGIMAGLETKALEYERQNRAALEAEYLGKPKQRAEGSGKTTAAQRQINELAKGGKESKITKPEKSLLKNRIKTISKSIKEGIKIGTKEGEQAGKAAAQNAADLTQEEITRRAELDKLKQRIVDRARAEDVIAEKKAGYEETVAKLKDRTASVAGKRQTLIDYAKAFLPFRERGKFLQAIENTSSDKEFADVLSRMQKATDIVERKNLIGEISKELKDTKLSIKNKMPSAKFEYTIQKKLNSIRANANGDYGDAQQKIAELVSDFQTAHPDQVLPDDLVEEIQMLKMVGIKEMTAPELRSMLADIQSLKETGRTKKQIERFNRDAEIERARDKIYDTLTGGQALPSEGQSVKQRPLRPSIKDAIKNYITVHNNGLEELLDDLSKFDKGSKPYNSFLSKYVQDQTDASFIAEGNGEISSISKISEAMKDAYGVQGDKDVLAEINDMKEVQNLGKALHADGVTREIQVSRGQAMQYYMWYKDPTLADTFTEGLKWSDQVKQKIFGILKPEDIKMADKLLDFYREYYKGVNEVFSKETGADLPFNENYSPVSRDVETTIPESTLLAQEIKNYASTKNGSLKNRVRNNIELKPTDALENVTRHIAQMEHYKAWSESMFNIRRVFGNKEIRRAILDLHGQADLKAIDGMIEDMARGGVSREKVIVQLDKIRSNVTKAMLGLNAKVGIKQLSGIFDYAIELPMSKFFGGVSNFWAHPIRNAKFLYDNSPVLRERFGEGYDRDLKFAIQRGYAEKLSNTKNFSEMMFVLTRNADKFTVYQGAWASYRAAYDEAIAAGKSSAEAKAAGIQYAERVTARVQESSRLDSLSDIQRGGSLAKLFTMFQSQQSKYLRAVTNGMRNYKYGRGSKAANARRVFVAWFVVPLIYNIVANQLTKKDKRLSNGQIVAASALGPLSTPLVFGNMFQSAFGWFTHSNTFNYSPTATTAFMDDLLSASQKFNKKHVTTGDITEGISYLIDTIGKLKGVPTTVVTKPLRNEINNNKK